MFYSIIRIGDLKMTTVTQQQATTEWKRGAPRKDGKWRLGAFDDGDGGYVYNLFCRDKHECVCPEGYEMDLPKFHAEIIDPE